MIISTKSTVISKFAILFYPPPFCLSTYIFEKKRGEKIKMDFQKADK